MKSFSHLLIFRVGALLALMGLARASHAQSIEPFDVPGASATSPQAVNAFGKITGTYADSSGQLHGFVRSPFGTITSFDAPSVGVQELGGGTSPSAINAVGQIAGSVYGAIAGIWGSRGFVRDERGTLTEFDAVPGALQTEPQAINELGWVAGTYEDAKFASHGFVRSPRGALSSFDTPGFIGWVREIRVNGDVIGVHQLDHGDFHGFVREPNGTFSTFDAPDVDLSVIGVYCGRCGGTFPTAAAPTGQVVGYYAATGGVLRSFLRKPDGAFSSLDVPQAAWTMPNAVNLEGAVAGTYMNAATSLVHGFLLPSNGVLESFDLPNATYLTVAGLDPDNEVIGTYSDASGTHGFIRKPRAGCNHFHF